MRILCPLALVLMVSAGCTPRAPPVAADYHLAVQAPFLVLAFVPGSDEPGAIDADRLHDLEAVLPAWAVPELHAAGPRMLARARSVRRLLGRPIMLVMDQSGQTVSEDMAILLTSPSTGIVADACLGHGQPVTGDVWPGNDAGRPALLPAGCAVATALQTQVAAAGAGQDLLRGRLLPAGAGTPFADAIERYYRRNDPGQRSGSAATGVTGRGGGETTTSSQGAAGQPTPRANPANPLLGPLPDSSEASP